MPRAGLQAGQTANIHISTYSVLGPVPEATPAQSNPVFTIALGAVIAPILQIRKIWHTQAR